MWELFDGKCPNYVVNTFTPNDSNQPYPVEDCVPVRTMYMLQDLNNRLVGAEKSIEEMRNVTLANEALSAIVRDLLQTAIAKYKDKQCLSLESLGNGE